MNTRAQAPAAQQGQDDGYEEEFEGEGTQGGDAEGGDDSSPHAAGQPDAEGADNGEDEGQGSQAGLGFEDDDLADFGIGARPRQSRGQDRIQRLANENAELRRRLDQQRTGAPPVQVTQPTGQGSRLESEEQFQARLQLMNPEDRMNAQMERFRQESLERDRIREAQALQREQQQNMARDRDTFDAKALNDARYARWQERVEAKHQELLAQGQFVPREVCFKFLLGEHLLSREGRQEGQRQAKRGQQRVQRQTTRPTNAGSDVGGGRGRQTEAQARAKRLENMQI